MAALPHADSKRMYSWWWDSHISPKNSKWLQENLSDMDAKVKQMIKLIEEDADSFARRAEMYYKKRPELMKLVEEFYRAYRALAERYDHATGVIHQAHRTMAEAFPNQVPLMLADDLPAVSSTDTEHTPRHSHAFLDPDESTNDASTNFHANAIKRNGAYTDEPDSAISIKGLKELDDFFMSGEPVSHTKLAEGRARRGLNFLDTQEISGLNNGSHDTNSQVLSESERLTKAETEIFALKKALAKLESEKEAGLLQYQQTLERLSNLESEVSRARENSQGLDGRVRKAEAEVHTLKETLVELQAERDASLLQYQQGLEKISNLEKNISSTQKDVGELNERATRAETDAESLKQDLARAEAQKEAALFQYNQSLKRLSKLEKRVVQAEENVRRITEQADIAKNEIEAMKLEIAKLNEEKEDAALHYQQCLEIISNLKHTLSCAEEEVHKLNCKVADDVEKLQSSEHKCLLLETSNQTLQLQLQSLAQKMGSQNVELSEKQKELSRLWTCTQEERLRFNEAETAFQTLQNLHSQSQEELRSLASELHKKAEILENVESCKQALEHEVHRVKEENEILNELKLSSSFSIKNLQAEILNLRETIEKLEQEVRLQVDQRNALKQQIYCLNEELNVVNKRLKSMMEEVGSTGLDPHCFGSYVKKLQDENSKLKETCGADKGEKAALLEKLEIMEKLLEKNAILEKSVSDLNAELESTRGKVKLLEETCQSFIGEKSVLAVEKANLFSQLQSTAEKLEKFSEKNNLLENSLFDVNAELEVLRVKSKILEDSCRLLDHEKSSLTSEKVTVVSQWNTTHQTLKDIEKQHSELELQHLEVMAEKESALQKVEELLVSLYAEREEHSRVMQLNEGHLAEKELQIQILQEDANYQKKEYEEELDRALHAQMEIFILQKCIQDLEQKNVSLLVECQRLLELSKMSDRLISTLDNDNAQKQVDMNSLSNKIKMSDRLVEDLKSKYDEARVILDDQASQILKLSSVKDCQNEELAWLCQVNKKLEYEMRHLHQELREARLREDKLSYELHKGTDEIAQWETYAVTLYAGLQISAVNETLFEGKVLELADACENLERTSNSTGTEGDKLKERISELECENGRLRANLAAYVPAVSALNDCIASLEMQTLVHAKPDDYKESKVKNLSNHQYSGGGPQTGDDQNAMVPEALPNLEDMWKRINAIEMAIKQMNGTFRPRDEMREVQVLKSGLSQQQGNIKASKHVYQIDEAKEVEHKAAKSMLDIPVAEKDIMLDQMSECSSYGINRRGTLHSDDHMLELWETVDKDGSIGLKVGKAQKMAGATKEPKNKSPCIQSSVEKELSVDKLEISTRLAQPREEGNKRKILERLECDAQKLTNLEITVQDLMNKVEMNDRSTTGKGVEYDTVKGQLEAAQEAMTKLFDANRKLMKNVEEGSNTVPYAGKSATESDESGSISRRRFSEQARRGSEKIGRLQLEVQRLQFLLLKLNDEKEGKGKTIIDDQNPRALLRDYLYGGRRINYHKRKKKKAPFCACMQPPTKGD